MSGNTCELPYMRDLNYTLDACGRQVPPANTSWIDIPAHIMYTRFMPGDGVTAGSTDIGGVMHKGRVSFMLRGMTAQILPRNSQGVYWRLRLPSGLYFQDEMSGHASSFGFGSDRQLFTPPVEWKPGEKLFVDLDSILAGPPPVGGYTVVFMFEGVYRFPVSGSGSVRNPLDALQIPRYFLTPNQNILAPQHMFGPGCPSETPDGFQDEEFCYVTPTKDLPITGATQSNIQLQIQPDSDFIIQQIWPYFPGVSPNGTTQGTGSYVVRIRRGDGYVLSSNFLPILSIQGPLFGGGANGSGGGLFVRRGDSIYWDGYVVDTAGAVGSVVTSGLYLYGVKRRKVIG